MILHVESGAGPHGDMEPHAFMLGSRRLAVLQIVDRWLSRDHAYFKVQASDGNTYILRHDEPRQEWELILFQAPENRS